MKQMRMKLITGLFIAMMIITAFSTLAVKGESPIQPTPTASYTSTQTGDWNDVATWGGGGYPQTGDTATIANTHTVTITGHEVCAGVTVQTGGTLVMTTHTLSLSGTFDSSAGTFTQGTGNLNFTSSASLKLKYVSSTTIQAHNITIQDTATVTLTARAVLDGVLDMNNCTTSGGISGASQYLYTHNIADNSSSVKLGTNSGWGSLSGLIMYMSANMILDSGTYPNFFSIFAESNTDIFITAGGDITHSAGGSKLSLYSASGYTGTAILDMVTYDLITDDITIGYSSNRNGELRCGSGVVDSSNVIITATTGTINAESSHIQISGDYAESGNFIKGTSIIEFDGSIGQDIFYLSEDYNDFIISNSGNVDINIAGTPHIYGDFNITSNTITLDALNWIFKPSIYKDADFTESFTLSMSNSSYVMICGSVEQTIKTGNHTFSKVYIDNSHASDSVIFNGNLPASHTLQLWDGDLDLQTNNNNLVLSGHFNISDGSSFSANQINITGNKSSIHDASATKLNLGDVICQSNGVLTANSNLTFENITINNGGSFQAGENTIVINGNYTSLATAHKYQIWDTIDSNEIIKSDANPELTKGSGGSWDEYGIRDNCILTDPYGEPVKNGDVYTVYYDGRTNAGLTSVGVSNLTRNADKSNASMVKDGRSPVLEPSDMSWADASADVFVGSVIKNGTNDYIMFFGGSNTGNYDVYYATSTDGYTWVPETTPIINDSDFSTTRSINYPCVRKLQYGADAGKWIMYIEHGAIDIVLASADNNDIPTGSWSVENAGDPIITTSVCEWATGSGIANPRFTELGAGKYILGVNAIISPGAWRGAILYSDAIDSGWLDYGKILLDVGPSGDWDDARIEHLELFKDDIGTDAVGLLYFGLPSSDSFLDGAIGYGYIHQTDYGKSTMNFTGSTPQYITTTNGTLYNATISNTATNTTFADATSLNSCTFNEGTTTFISSNMAISSIISNGTTTPIYINSSDGSTTRYITTAVSNRSIISTSFNLVELLPSNVTATATPTNASAGGGSGGLSSTTVTFGFTYDIEGHTVYFTYNGTEASEYNWAFGDGYGTTDKNPIYEYGAPGYYNVTLEIELENGATMWTTKMIFIEPGPQVNTVFGDQIPIEKAGIYIILSAIFGLILLAMKYNPMSDLFSIIKRDTMKRIYFTLIFIGISLIILSRYYLLGG